MIGSVLLSSSLVGTNLIYLLAIVAMMGYFSFTTIRQQKERKKMIDSVEIGDSISTISGFYGTVIDIIDENLIIVEFGNENCRVPMKKIAIDGIEKGSKTNAQEVEDADNV